MDYGRETVEFFEIDQPFCSLTYGEAPCAAVLGGTGTRKCFNTLKSCQDEGNFTPGTLTLRFARPNDALPGLYGPIIPLLEEVKVSAMVVNVVGIDDSVAPFGKREKINVTLLDSQYPDFFVDKYRLERAFVEGPELLGVPIGDAATFAPGLAARGRRAMYGAELLAEDELLGSEDPARRPGKRGTFWTKWIARNPYYSTMRCRHRRGFVGQALEEMNVRNYVVERVQGPGEDGNVTITAKDLFSKVESRKAVAPKASRGSLTAAATGAFGAFTVEPAGIGDADYAAITAVTQGYVAIGHEIIKCTRSSDTFTVVQRAALNTEQEDHDDEDLVQLVLWINAQLCQDAAHTLLTQYSGILSSEINLAEWDQAAASITQLFTAYVASPAPVAELLGALMVEAGITIWPDIEAGMVKLAALQAGAATPTVDDSWIRADSLQPPKRRDDKRVSQVWVYYGLRNPLESRKEPRNFASRAVTLTSSNPYVDESARKVYSVFLPKFAKQGATRCGEMIYAMYSDPPIEIEFDLDRGREGELAEARYFTVETDEIGDFEGDPLPTAMICTSIERREEAHAVNAMTVRFAEFSAAAGGDNVRRISIDHDDYSLNLRAIYDSQFVPPTGGEVIEFTVEAGVTVGSTDCTVPAMETGSWPGVSLKLINKGTIKGSGGDGTSGGTVSAGGKGKDGGTALKATVALTVDNALGHLLGGGGGGGGGGGARSFDVGEFNTSQGGGGGGAVGRVPGSASSSGQGDATDGTETAAGVGGTGEANGTAIAGDGGDAGAIAQPGQPGTAGTGNVASYAGGARGEAGKYVDGDSLITWLANGDRQGNVS